MNEEGHAALCLCDEEGNVRAGFCLSTQGVPQLRMVSESGGVRAAIGFGTAWRPGLVLTDRDGQVVWSAVSEHF